MAEIKKEYYPHIDGLKGLAILLMVMAHALAWSYPDSHFVSHRFCDMSMNEFNASFIWKFIYSFHMPLLFAVSGFLFYKPMEYTWDNSRAVLWKRVLRILVPYLVTGVLVLFLKGYFGYWFLQILFILNCVLALESMFMFYIKASSRIEVLSHFAIYCLLFVGCKFLGRVSLPQELHNLSGLDGYYLAFVLGYLIRKFPRVEDFISEDKYSFIAFVIFVSLFAVANTSLHIPFIATFVPVAAIVFLWSAFKKVNYGMGGAKLLTLIGKNSLEIYILHLFFVMPFHEVGEYILKQDNFAMSITLQITYSMIVSTVAIVLSISIANILKKNNILSKLIFGV